MRDIHTSTTPPAPLARNIVLADFNAASREQVANIFVEEGYRVFATQKLENVARLIKDKRADFALIEWYTHPPYTSLDFIKNHADNIPIFCFTKNDKLLDLVQSLNAGAADYIKKPCLFPELLARINRVLNQQAKLLHHGDFALNLTQNILHIAGDTVALNDSETQILKTLMQNRGKATSPQQLLANMDTNDTQSNIIAVYIKNLRKKHPRLKAAIRTHYGKGYGFIDYE